MASCSNAQEPMRLPVDSTQLTILSDNNIIARFDIEVASTDANRSAGLMFRTDLPKDRGMLFVFDDDEQRFFWMQNTPTPLDIIYADRTGKIVHISYNTVPFSTQPIPSQFPARYAFEIHAGLSKMLGISINDQLMHTIIEKK